MNAKYGLCGGMSLAAILSYKYEIPTPKNKTVPNSRTSSVSFSFLKAYQLASL
ncbi:hypothetical protein MHYMCMPSP_00565 [Hyalomma marginatum]|uniref:Uncharacterized protein n=1 Tax=Hyalomma marginatum TaxID=34627 RepID=A0A8S4BU26_9ACAR|nr:hypothetical protein MHYMCMPASI_00292 [Hyalomma marginatum]CAG7591926.1 hypothetical protein MHYMCMPSP_00565 [Hyalomma marginatum]